MESALGLKGAGETRPSPARDMHVAACGSRAGSYLLHDPDHAAKDPARRIRPYPDFRVGVELKALFDEVQNEMVGVEKREE